MNFKLFSNKKSQSKENDEVSGPLDNVLKECDNHMKSLLNDIDALVKEQVNDMNSLNTSDLFIYNLMTDIHNRVDREVEKRFTKSFDVDSWWRFKSKYKALYRRTLEPIYTMHIGYQIDEIFNTLESFCKVTYIYNKYHKTMLRSDEFLLESILGYHPYGNLRDQISNSMIRLNGNVMNILKQRRDDPNKGVPNNPGPF